MKTIDDSVIRIDLSQWKELWKSIEIFRTYDSIATRSTTLLFSPETYTRILFHYSERIRISQ